MAKKKVKKKPVEESSAGFEEALETLEQIVSDLEQGDLDLDQALDQYERGVGLLKGCHKKLAGAERRIELLSGIDADGNPVTRPFENEASGEGDESLEAKSASRSRKRSRPTATTDDSDDDSRLF